ncbi:MAG TPA: pantoate--beta-alanine ligase, partial [Aquabacterium sp.]|nr:pantoate--beta-alanine ligase [Aquabacterium sp.]
CTVEPALLRLAGDHRGSEQERAEAVQLITVLRGVREQIHAQRREAVLSEDSVQQLEAQAMAALSAWGWQPDYVAVRRQRDLLAASNDDLARGEPLVCLSAARLGKTRLIDNLEI